MRRALVAEFPQAGRAVQLADDEAHHLVKVLRLKDGAQIELLNGLGTSCIATLRLKGKKVWAEFAAYGRQAEPHEPLPIHLFIALAKPEAMSWIVEKAVELNVASVYPFVGEHSVVRLKVQGKAKKRDNSVVERLQRQAQEATKQCGRLTNLAIHPVLADLPSVLANPAFTSCHHRWVADEGLLAQREHLLAVRTLDLLPRQRVAVLIGPEGGWSLEERHAFGDLKRISLGSQVLRVETAAVMVAAVLAAHLQCH